MITGKIGLPAYLTTVSSWREDCLAVVAEKGCVGWDPATCPHCERGISDVKYVLFSCPWHAPLCA